MSLQRQPLSPATAIDALLQPTYLMVVQLRHGGQIRDPRKVQRYCIQQVEALSPALQALGLSDVSVERIRLAQCVLLDETLLACADEGTRGVLAGEPLQARFFGHHQGGETLYEAMRQVLAEPAPDPHVLVAYLRVLMLGFQGRYRETEHPERAQLLEQLYRRVPALQGVCDLPTAKAPRGSRRALGFHNHAVRLVGHVALASLLLVAVWWALGHSLDSALASLLPEQARL